MLAIAGRFLTFADTGVRLPVLLLAGGCLNGFAVRIVESLAAGQVSLSLGLSPFEVIAPIVAVKLSWPPAAHAVLPDASASLGWAEIVTLVLILVPSSAVAWAAVAGYAALHARRSHGLARTGALLFAALAACALWSSVALKAMAGPVTSAEAFVVGHLVALVRPDIVQSGNVIGNPEVHSLILMTACTTANGCPLALLALTAVWLVLGGTEAGRGAHRRLWVAGCALVALYACANVVRLAFMSLSGDAYALAHGPIGANLFDAATSFAVVALGYRASRP